MASTLHVTTAEYAVPASVRQVRDRTAGLTVTDLLLLLMAFIWGANYIVAKYGTQVFAPLAFNSVRIALATVVLWTIVLVRRSAMPSRADALALFALGLLGNGLYQIFFVEGLARARASDTALVLAASPAFMAIIGRVRGVDQIGWRGAAGIALSLAGIGLVVSGKPSTPGTSSTLGYTLTIAACLCWALYTVLLKPYTERIDGITLAAVTMSGGLLPMLIVGAPSILATRWASAGPMAWAAVVYSGVLALVVAYFCWYRGVRVLGPTRASMYANLQPLFAMAIAWAVLGEAPHLMQGAGALCIMIGLLMTRAPAMTPARVRA